MFSYQRTIKNSVSCFGIGLHSGKDINLTLKPAAEDTGIVFKRMDVKTEHSYVAANYANVVKTQLGTTIANEFGVEIETIEHLMAAFWGCMVDNCIVELDGSEIPIMDGSSEPFMFLIECAGIHEQKVTRRFIEVIKEVVIEDERTGGFISLKPYDGFSVDLVIDFGDNIIAKQNSIFDSKKLSFKSDLSRARTFCFEREVEAMRTIGLAKGGSLDNAIVVGQNGILNKENLRYNNEFVKHKILDCIGDLFLSGGYLKALVTGYKSGHALNNKLLRKFFADLDAWREVKQYPVYQENLAA